ncbi:MAG: CehA/McbA family metallohydrolase, partial [Cyclobacteriaceae bacterium]|nr:CehA/McbA family metallohydrolase [Cyclobacteriaceae bacterium]
LVYAMAGSLWIQEVGTTTARQLTAGDGYDFQPDCSPVSDEVVFVRYNGESMELMLLDLKAGTTSALTSNRQVNVEPRWSPDGTRLAFVSTLVNGHFLIHVGKIQNLQLSGVVCVTPDRKSMTPRYYYSPWDHSINPEWSADGSTLYFVTNREEPHGTGNLTALPLSDPTSIHTVIKEETTWAMRPDVSPDGSRVVYASYLGRNWHQLWLLPVQGGNPFPITYGEYDNKNPRWSPDGQRIAYISNRHGNTSLWTISPLTGKDEAVLISSRIYLKSHKTIEIRVVDEAGQPVPARVSITDAAHRSYFPTDAWVHSDDARYPAISPYEQFYFNTQGSSEVVLPVAAATIAIRRGHLWQQVQRQVAAEESGVITIVLKKLNLPPSLQQSFSGDLHVHMNYTGHYLNSPAHLRQQAASEDLQYVFDLIVNKEQRIPDIRYFSAAPDPVSTPQTTIIHSQEFHTSYWGHLGLLGLKDHFILPGYAGYPQTAAASLWPSNSFIADEAHAQQALVGYVHPFLQEEIFPHQDSLLTNAAPVDAALRKVDYFEVIGFSDHRTSEYVWHQLLNAGLKLPAGAGTDFMANFANVRGPIGLNRVYVPWKENAAVNQFMKAVKAGQSFVSNGPLLQLQVEGTSPGDSLNVTSIRQVRVSGSLRSNVPVDHLEVMMNGKVAKVIQLTGDRRTADFSEKVAVKGPGWITLHAYNDQGHPDVFDLYPFATTNPVYLFAGNARIRSKAAGNFFIEWIKRMDRLSAMHPSWRNDAEKNAVHQQLMDALKYYESVVRTANAD